MADYQKPDDHVFDEDFIQAQAAEVNVGPPPTTAGRIIRYRHDWGSWRGTALLKLNRWADIRPDTIVLVSISEGRVPGDTVAGKFIGNAVYTLHNVAARSDGVDIRVNIAWDTPINLQADYLAVLF